MTPKSLVGCLCPGLKWKDKGKYPSVLTSEDVFVALSKVIRKTNTKKMTVYDGKETYRNKPVYDDVLLKTTEEFE